MQKATEENENTYNLWTQPFILQCAGKDAESEADVTDKLDVCEGERVDLS